MLNSIQILSESLKSTAVQVTDLISLMNVITTGGFSVPKLLQLPLTDAYTAADALGRTFF